MPKREPHEVWKAVVQEAADDEREFQRAAGASPEEVDASLREKGVDPGEVRAEAGEWRREIEQRVALRKAREAEQRGRTRSTRPQARSGPIVWLIAAAVGAAVGGALVYATMHPTPAPPPPAPSTPAPTPPAPSDTPLELVSAESLRRDGLAECYTQQWARCLADLDRARDMDPAGDTAPAIRDARDRAIRAIMHKNR